ncbi:MAG TPA: hypothetical protein VM510_09420 [Caulifigura sp.]|nr:hypothetical protein [Caulifigura sp.]
MLLSLWFWGRKIEGRRSLFSIDGAFLFFVLILLILMTVVFGVLREAR